MRSLACVAALALCAMLLTVAAYSTAAPDAYAGTLSVQPESLLYAQPGSDECELGNLCADAARGSAQTALALIPAGALQNDLPVGSLTWADLTNAVADTPLMAATVTPAQLYALLEGALGHIAIDAETETLLHEQSQFDGFLQISGFSLTIDASAPAGSRAYRVVLSDGTTLSRSDNSPAISLVTTATVADGTYGYRLETDVSPAGLTLAEALSAYLTANEITAIETGRIRHIGTTDSALVNQLPGWGLAAALAIVAVCCLLFRGKERASKPFRPMQEGETKRKY